MKVATLMGSPRKKGNTARVLELFENLLKKNGHEIDRINIVDYEVKGCLGCRQEDDAVKVSPEFSHCMLGYLAAIENYVLRSYKWIRSRFQGVLFLINGYV